MAFNDGMTPSQSNPHKMGGLVLARVINVYPLDMCLDVTFTSRGDFPSAPFRIGGKGQLDYRVPVLQQMAGATPTESWFSEETGWGKTVNLPLTGYGSVVLPQVGDYVIVGFLNEDIHRPIVLGSIHPFWREMNVTGKTDDIEDTEGPTHNLVTNEQGRFATVFPSMVWWKVNAQGEIEISLPMGKSGDNLGGSFIKIGKGDVLNNLQSMSGTVAQLKEMVTSAKSIVSAIKDSTEGMEIINDLITNNEWSDPDKIEAACKDLRQIIDIKKVIDGDPRPDEVGQDACGGGCCCGPCGAATTCTSSTYTITRGNTNCSCGSTWSHDTASDTYASTYDTQQCQL